MVSGLNQPKVCDADIGCGARTLDRASVSQTRSSVGSRVQEVREDDSSFGRGQGGQVRALGDARGRFPRADLGAEQTGLNFLRVKPSQREAFAHRHRIAEEIYVVFSGTGRVKLDA